MIRHSPPNPVARWRIAASPYDLQCAAPIERRTNTIVLDADHQPMLVHVDGDLDSAGAGMLEHVRKGFLHDTEYRDRGFGNEVQLAARVALGTI